MLILFFIAWKIIDIIASYITPIIIPYWGNFAYPKDLLLFHLPKAIYSFANFDGIYYLRIAKFGYQQYEQAFFPLYPILIRALTPIFNNNHLLTGLFISNICFFFGLFVFQKYLKLTMKQFNNVTIIFLLLFPTSFFFGAVYTESLFFLLVIAVFYFLNKKNYWLAGLIAFLAGLTRVNGILLVIPFIIEFARNFKKNKNLWQLGILLIAPLLGLLTYMRYLLITTGDAWAFFHSQSVFGPARSTKIILLPQVFYRYFKILLTANFNFQYFISFLEIVFFSFVFIILILDFIKNFKFQIKNYSLISLNLFSLANILLPTFTGSFMSLPRFSLLSLSFFIYLGSIKSSMIKYIIGGIFTVFHLLLLGLFLQGYFIS